MQQIRHALRVIVLGCALSFESSAADKSGVGPNTISLPKGPGAIEGLGESFQPTLNTGTAKYGLALKVPPGTAGHAPGLSLGYEGGGGNGPLGFGWTLPMSYVQRRSDHGIPTYGESVGFDRQDTFINETKEELVPLTNGFYFCKNESSFIRYRQVNGHWEGVLPNGTRMEFGLTAEARIQDTNATPEHVFCWLLQRETDTHGNTIVYSYAAYPGPNNSNQKYLSAIGYGPGAPPWDNFHFVTFEYGDRPDWFEDCRSGFVVRTGKRLRTIVIGSQGPTLTNHLAGDFNGDGRPDHLDRKYMLEYLDYAGTNSHWSLLAGIIPVGADGVSRLPPVSFGYSVCNPPDALSAAGQIIGGTNEPPMVMDNPLVDFVDLNGDGLPDILATTSGGGVHTGYLNRGELAAPGGNLIRWEDGMPMDSEDGRAWLFDLRATASIAHLADMDGDGVADLAVTALDGSVFYFPNQAKLAWGSRRDMSIQDSSPPSPFGNPQVRTADIDFDKRIDIIESISTGDGTAYRIWFNLGNQSYSPGVTVPQNSGVAFSTTGMLIADINGDRVPDIVRVTPAVVVVMAGLGYGHFADPVSVAIPDLVLDDVQVAKATLSDINGDGLADLVLERAVPGQFWYWLNLGNYTFSHRKVITDMPLNIGAGAVTRWADLNGNGTTDLIYADASASPRLQTVDVGQLINSGTTPNVLVAISNGIGRVTLIHYQPSTVFALTDAAVGRTWPDLMPNPVQVVSAVTNLDSLGHSYVTLFHYHDGYYDPAEKQFRGFAEAEQVDVGDPAAPTLVTRSRFDTGNTFESMKGKLIAVSVEQEDGKTFSVETNFWTTPPVTLYTGSNGTNVVYAHPTGKVKVISELGRGIPRRLESEFAYDNYGNQTTNADYGIVESGNRAVFDDERIVTTDYALNLDAWLVRHPRRQETSTLNGTVISRTEYYYDDETFSGANPGVVTTGNLTLRRDWITASNATSFIQAARNKYDAFGNPFLLLDPLATAPGGAVDLTKGHTREITHDSRFQAYAVAETIHVGNGSRPLLFQARYDEGFGAMTSSIDFNTNITTYGYDAFARLVNIVQPDDTPDFPTTEFDYVLALPVGSSNVVNYVETRQLDKAPGQPPVNDHRGHYFISRQFVDGLGRPLMGKHEAEPASPGGPPRVVVKGAVLYNARQRPFRTLNPCYSTLPASDLESMLAFEDISAAGWQGLFSDHGQLVARSFAGAHQASIAYDATLREIAQTNQDGTFRRTAYEPLLTRSYDENQTDPASAFFGSSMAHFQDGLGRLVRVDEIVKVNDDGTPAAAPHTWSTSYEYDVNDQLTRITDSQDNVKAMQYDGLQRKTSMNDPDRGVMLYDYDDASNLAQTVDAKGQHILFTYDGANRLLTETYARSQLSPRLGEDRGEGAVNVAYHYDTPAGMLGNGDGSGSVARNTAGMLSFVSDCAGEDHTSYDARGRVAYILKRVPDPTLLARLNSQPASVLVNFRTAFEYDSLNRLTRLVYPDNDQVEYRYDAQTRLKQIVGGPSGNIISNIAYWPSQQQRETDFGNGVRTACGYDERLRMTSLSTAPAAFSANPLLAFSYLFDGVSNLRLITDQRPASAAPLGNPLRNTQLFRYDDLNRLTRVQYSFNLPGDPVRDDGSIDYRYDRIGNLLSQTSNIQQFEQGRSVTQLGDVSYGGPAGRSGRIGRGPNDPPGPHALTAVSQLSTNSPQPRVYPYDANGNMTNVDGLSCTWDFKDRLVAVEDENMRADYTYDYTDRRITKRVTLKKKARSPPDK
jgi:YD repeat-containing protein